MSCNSCYFDYIQTQFKESAGSFVSEVMEIGGPGDELAWLSARDPSVLLNGAITDDNNLPHKLDPNLGLPTPFSYTLYLNLSSVSEAYKLPG